METKTKLQMNFNMLQHKRGTIVVNIYACMDNLVSFFYIFFICLLFIFYTPGYNRSNLLRTNNKRNLFYFVRQVRFREKQKMADHYCYNCNIVFMSKLRCFMMYSSRLWEHFHVRTLALVVAIHSNSKRT